MTTSRSPLRQNDLARKLLRPTYKRAEGLKDRASDWNRRRIVKGAPSCRDHVSPVPVLVVAVYRHRNALVLHKLLSQLPTQEVYLWALDEPVEALAAHTVGSGPGGKWQLANRLVEQAAAGDDRWLMVVDDDVCFSSGDGCRFVDLAVRSGFDICQPAHGPFSLRSYEFNRARPLARSSWTGFVEIGPMVLFSARALSRVYPFPEDLMMGWGTELYWHGLQSEGFRLGVVDGSSMLHIGRVARHYDVDVANQSLDTAVADTGVTLADTMQRHGTWWRWQHRPPWLAP